MARLRSTAPLAMLCLALTTGSALPADAAGADAAGARAAGQTTSPAGEDVAQTTARIGAPPDFCARLAEEAQVCTWHVARSEHVVCAFGAPELLGSECLRTPDNEDMQTFTPRRPRTGAKRMIDRRGQQKQARTELDQAKTLAEVIRLVGAGPRWCAEGSSLSCSWHLTRRTPGYILFARVANAPGKKLNVFCSFPSALEARAAESCTVRAGGRPAPPTS